jgi:hypothetical protein
MVTLEADIPPILKPDEEDEEDEEDFISASLFARMAAKSSSIFDLLYFIFSHTRRRRFLFWDYSSLFPRVARKIDI